MEILSMYRSFILFDTETMGLKDYDKIIQFSGILYEINSQDFTFMEKDYLNIYINPEETVPKKITKITGLSNQFLDEEKPEADVAPRIFSFLEKADFLVAYNARFDYKKLAGMAKRTGLQMPKKPIMDLLPKVRDCLIGEVEEFNLESVTTYCFPGEDLSFHDALDDVRASGLMMGYCVNQYQEAILASYDAPMKRKAHLNWASCSINPRQASQQRIKMNLDDNQFGNVFWDIRRKCWDSKKDKTSKKIFEEIDLPNLESQFLRKYGHGCHDMDAVAEEMFKRYKLKKKEA